MTPISRATVVDLWCSPQPPEFWREVWYLGLDWPGPQRFWIAVRGWGALALANPEFDLADMHSDVTFSLDGMKEVFELACTPAERLFAMQQAQFGGSLPIDEDWGPDDSRAATRFFLQQDMGDPDVQRRYVDGLLSHLEVYLVVSEDVTDEDIKAFKDRFPRRTSRLRNAEEALESTDLRLMRVGLGLLGPERDAITRRVEAYPKRPAWE